MYRLYKLLKQIATENSDHIICSRLIHHQCIRMILRDVSRKAICACNLTMGTQVLVD